VGTDEKSLLNFRVYLVLALSAVISPFVLIMSVLGGQWGPAALSLIVLVIAVTLIFIGAQKDIERRRKRRPPCDDGAGL
jgi:hypothetical protein